MSKCEVCWAVVFMKDGLDVEWAKQYFTERGTEVTDVIENGVDFQDDNGNAEDNSNVLFVLRTPNSILVPFRIIYELNLKQTNTPYLYMPVERT